jgi:nitronate monooxygenase
VLTTRFTEMIGCSVPIQEAPVAAWPRLAIAVANAGALGMVQLSGYAPRQIATLLDGMRAQTSGVFGVNFLPFADSESAPECVAAAAARSKVIDFFYFDPDRALVEVVHSAGALASWQVGSREEALAAVDAGCDFIIAQGIEAGGHVRGRIGLLALLGEVLETVSVPVLAAGGIGTARAFAAVLAAGTAGARMGTRFVAAEESDAHPEYVRALIAAQAKDTIYTDVFDVGWPDAPHRVLRACVEAAQAFQGDIVGERHTDTGERIPIRRFQPLPISKAVTGAIAAMPHWAGESVDAVKRVQSAAEIINEVAGGAEQLLRRGLTDSDS